MEVQIRAEQLARCFEPIVNSLPQPSSGIELAPIFDIREDEKMIRLADHELSPSEPTHS